MRLLARLAAVCLALCAASQGALAGAAEGGCRIAFDIGSSGIRAGLAKAGEKAGKGRVAHADIDYLSPQWAGEGLAPAIAPTIAALRDLPATSGFPATCQRVGAGFSAWRLALKSDDEGTVALLARIRDESGVPVLVIPQSVEGRYGYSGARSLLGKRLKTSHVLDIGGGSLQIAGANETFGLDLGQKAWHRLLCRALRPGRPPDCNLQPMSRQEITKARALLTERLHAAGEVLPARLTLTAISRPVTRGVFPAVARLTALVPKASDEASPGTLTQARIAAAIERLATMPADEAARRLDIQPKYLTFLLSDLLLVDGVLAATGTAEIAAADVDLTNLPALLDDDQAYAWSERYGCYLTRLQRWGAGAYYTDPASCPPP